MLDASMRSAWPAILTLPHHLTVVAHGIFGIAPESADRLLPLWISAAALAVWCAGALVFVRWRVRVLEGGVR